MGVCVCVFCTSVRHFEEEDILEPKSQQAISKQILCSDQQGSGTWEKRLGPSERTVLGRDTEEPGYIEII